MKTAHYHLPCLGGQWQQQLGQSLLEHLEEPHISWTHGITLDPADGRKGSEQVHQQLGCPFMSVQTSDGYTSLSGLVAERFALNAITNFPPPFIISPPFGHSLKVGFSSFFEKNISQKKCFLPLLDTPGAREDEQEALIL